MPLISLALAMDRSSKIQTLFTCLITPQFVVVALHNLVDIPGWTHGTQVESIIGRRKLWLVTLVNSVFPGLAVAFAIYFWNRPKPEWVSDYWILYCAVTLVFAIAMRYVPYFRGTREERKREYARMYAGTRQVLPPRGDDPPQPSACLLSEVPKRLSTKVQENAIAGVPRQNSRESSGQREPYVRLFLGEDARRVPFWSSG